MFTRGGNRRSIGPCAHPRKSKCQFLPDGNFNIKVPSEHRVFSALPVIVTGAALADGGATFEEGFLR
jgi:hypothetical protein